MLQRISLLFGPDEEEGDLWDDIEDILTGQ